MNTILQYAPLKGESQIAFRYDAKETFTLNDTNPGTRKVGPKKGYGQRNKSYLFKDGEVCGANSTICACSNVAEGNEQDVSVTLDDMTKYTTECGLVLRLWSYPTENVIISGLTPEEEVGFYCFFSKNYNTFLIYKPQCDKSKLVNGQKCSSYRNLDPSFCVRMNIASNQWRALPESERAIYRNEDTLNKNCKERMKLYFIKESCVRSMDRDQAQKHLLESLQLLQSQHKFDAIAKGYGRIETNCDLIMYYNNAAQNDNNNNNNNNNNIPPKMRYTMQFNRQPQTFINKLYTCTVCFSFITILLLYSYFCVFRKGMMRLENTIKYILLLYT